jgi:hypothetical protein
MEYQYRAIPRTTFRMGWPNVRFAADCVEKLGVEAERDR